MYVLGQLSLLAVTQHISVGSLYLRRCDEASCGQRRIYLTPSYPFVSTESFEVKHDSKSVDASDGSGTTLSLLVNDYHERGVSQLTTKYNCNQWMKHRTDRFIAFHSMKFVQLFGFECLLYNFKISSSCREPLKHLL